MIRHLREPMAFLQKLNSWFPPNDEPYREVPLSPGDLLFFQSSNCKTCLEVMLLKSPDEKLSYWRAAQCRRQTHWTTARAGIVESISFKPLILQRRKDRPAQTADIQGCLLPCRTFMIPSQRPSWRASGSFFVNIESEEKNDTHSFPCGSHRHVTHRPVCVYSTSAHCPS